MLMTIPKRLFEGMGVRLMWVSGVKGVEWVCSGEKGDENSHESYHRGNFDDGKDELCLAVSFCAKKIDDEDDDQENGDEYGFVDFFIPVPYRHGAG